jgi:predicted metal-dependent peptidase
LKKRIVMVNPGPRPFRNTQEPDDNDDDRVVIEPDALKHLKHARGRLIAPYARGGKPYLASAAMALTFVRRPGLGTLGVDSSWRLYYDPDEIIYWPVDALAAVIEHELWHLLREHHRRAQHVGVKTNADAYYWNAAADTEIHSNESLLEAVSKIPDSLPHSPELYNLPPKQTVEIYYKELHPAPTRKAGKEGYTSWVEAEKIRKKWEENARLNMMKNASFDYEGHWPPPHFIAGGDGNGGEEAEDYVEGAEQPTVPKAPVDWYEHMDPIRGFSGSSADGLQRPWELPPTDETINRAEDAAIRQSVARAIQGAKSRGIGVGDWVAEWAEIELAPAKVDWRDLLRNAIESAIQYQRGNLEYTWGRLSRRQVASPEFLLPGMHSPIPEVAVVLDTSGSMFTASYSATSEEMAEEGAKYTTLLHEALNEIGGLLEEYGTTVGVQVLATDNAVQSAQRVFDIEDIAILGGGGTDMGVGLAAIGLLEPLPNVVICLTDGYTPWPEERPEVEAEYVIGIVGAQEETFGEHWPAPAWADETIFIDEV